MWADRACDCRAAKISLLGDEWWTTKYPWLSQHRGLPNLIETILTDLRGILGFPRFFFESETVVWQQAELFEF